MIKAPRHHEHASRIRSILVPEAPQVLELPFRGIRDREVGANNIGAAHRQARSILVCVQLAMTPAGRCHPARALKFRGPRSHDSSKAEFVEAYPPPATHPGLPDQSAEAVLCEPRGLRFGRLLVAVCLSRLGAARPLPAIRIAGRPPRVVRVDVGFWAKSAAHERGNEAPPGAVPPPLALGARGLPCSLLP